MIDPHLNGSGRNWHAVFCKPRQDSVAESNLLYQGFETFRPKTRVARTRNGQRRVAVESMFPRYLFVRLCQRGQDWTPIRSTRGAIGLVRLGLETPVVPDNVIESLRRRCSDDGVISLAGAIDFQPDDLVDIIDGPMSGYRALFKARTSQERVVVLLQLLQHERRVELPDTSIRRA
ncbi:MAG: transcription/translation regulatory transformer protein RfaH [Wenzhouxiangella sp.]|nr:MAG: transcription/translation regulatory transformer protein RfaH [Wenzhouxiangella sp.]